MRETLKKRCDLFVANRDAIKSAFGWENTYIYPLCASIYTARNREADIECMDSCRDLLKQKTGLLSNFRGISKMATVTMLSLSPDPERQMDRILTVYDELKELFWGSEYLAVAASAIAELSDSEDFGKIAARTREIYNRMKSVHPFLTSGEDSAFAALLALSGLDDLVIEQQMEKCYTLLKPSFFSGNAVQALSHVLALGEGSAEEKCGKAIRLFDLLKNGGRKYGTSYELSTLGALTLLDADEHSIAADMLEVDAYLKEQRGFGTFGIGSKQRLMYAGMLVLGNQVPDAPTVQIAALNSVVGKKVCSKMNSQ